MARYLLASCGQAELHRAEYLHRLIISACDRESCRLVPRTRFSHS